MGIENPFYELGVILGIAALLGLASTLLRQPLIVAFIAVGIIVGPLWLNLAADSDDVDLLASIGIALLLFVVGLKLDLYLIRALGRVALVAGLGQVAFTAVLGFGLAQILGLDRNAAIYTAIALTFSSTIIIVKLLSDKREIDSLHGRIAVGILILQDILVVATMIGISAFGVGESDNGAWETAAEVFAKAVAMLVVVGLVMRFAFPKVLPMLARSQEQLILSSIAWAVCLAALGDALGFSKEVGAFLAGVSLASTPFRESISGRLTTVRDFMLLFFFVNLGSDLEFSGVGGQIGPALLLSVFVLAGKPLIVIAMMGRMGYRRRTSSLTGLTLGQVSEFSLIFAALGVSVGHIGSDTLGLITLVALITIGVSTYMILYSHKLYERLSGLLRPFERGRIHPEDAAGDTLRNCDLIIFGLGRYGSAIAQGLRERGKAVLGVDFDPQVVKEWHRQRWPVHYGDAEDPDLLHILPLQSAGTVVCAAPTAEANLTLWRALQEQGYEGRVVLTATNEMDAGLLQKAGATFVLRPFSDAAVRAVEELVYPEKR